MYIVTLTNGLIANTEVAMTRAELIEMISDGCFSKTPIESIFYMGEGGYIDITANIAKAIWDEYNADDRAPHYELEVWLNRFGHDCDGFGVTPEPRSMFVPPYRE